MRHSQLASGFFNGPLGEIPDCRRFQRLFQPSSQAMVCGGRVDRSPIVRGQEEHVVHWFVENPAYLQRYGDGRVQAPFLDGEDGLPGHARFLGEVGLAHGESFSQFFNTVFGDFFFVHGAKIPL